MTTLVIQESHPSNGNVEVTAIKSPNNDIELYTRSSRGVFPIMGSDCLSIRIPDEKRKEFAALLLEGIEE